jgi:alanine racemase
MNMTQIDLSNAPRAHAGSEVTLIGTDGESAVSADDWATWCDTINYEIVTRLPEQLPREYVE